MERDRIVVVTGASTGIGRACAELLAGDGWTVFAGVRREADGVPLRIHPSGLIRPVMLEVTDPDSIRAAFDEIAVAAVGRGLAGLVNNAGIALGGPLEFLPPDDLRRQFEVNLFGLLSVTQAALPLLRAGGGRIVQIGSTSGLAATPFLGPYCASKFALEGLTDALRMELLPSGIRVAIVEPGRIRTPIWDRGLAEAKRVRAGLPPEGLALYGPYLDRIDGVIEKAKREGIPAGQVARVVRHALTAGCPKTRYLVGIDAHIQVGAKRLLPARLFDRLAMFLLQRGWM